MPITTSGALFVIAFAALVTGTVLMVRTPRATKKDATHIKLGAIEITTASAGGLVFAAGFVMAIVAFIRIPADPTNAPQQPEPVNITINGPYGTAIGKIEGASQIVLKHAEQK